MELSKTEIKHIADYVNQYRTAKKFFSILPGELKVSLNDYELWRYKEEDNQVSILFYPHKTSCGNYHVRVRDQSSKNKDRADMIMQILDMLYPFERTFSRKMQ